MDLILTELEAAGGVFDQLLLLALMALGAAAVWCVVSVLFAFVHLGIDQWLAWASTIVHDSARSLYQRGLSLAQMVGGPVKQFVENTRVRGVFDWHERELRTRFALLNSKADGIKTASADKLDTLSERIQALDTRGKQLREAALHVSNLEVDVGDGGYVTSDELREAQQNRTRSIQKIVIGGIMLPCLMAANTFMLSLYLSEMGLDAQVPVFGTYALLIAIVISLAEGAFGAVLYDSQRKNRSNQLISPMSWVWLAATALLAAFEAGIYLIVSESVLSMLQLDIPDIVGKYLFVPIAVALVVAIAGLGHFLNEGIDVYLQSRLPHRFQREIERLQTSLEALDECRQRIEEAYEAARTTYDEVVSDITGGAASDPGLKQRISEWIGEMRAAGQQAQDAQRDVVGEANQAAVVREFGICVVFAVASVASAYFLSLILGPYFGQGTMPGAIAGYATWIVAAGPVFAAMLCGHFLGNRRTLAVGEPIDHEVQNPHNPVVKGLILVILLSLAGAVGWLTLLRTTPPSWGGFLLALAILAAAVIMGKRLKLLITAGVAAVKVALLLAASLALMTLYLVFLLLSVAVWLLRMAIVLAASPALLGHRLLEAWRQRKADHNAVSVTEKSRSRAA